MSFVTADPRASRRLFAFPHAGGTDAEARSWRAPLGWSIHGIALPGRGKYRHEQSYRTMEALVADLASQLPLDRPFAFYGHSFGAVVAWELTRELRRRGAPLPSTLALGARPAPHLPARHPQLSSLGTDAFVEHIRALYDGISPELLERPGLLRAFLGPLRADIRILERFVPQDEPPLDLPFVVLHGEGDRSLRVADVEAWAVHCAGRFVFHRVPGGHFFHRTNNIPDYIV